MVWQPDYVTVEELRGFLRITDTEDDAELTLAIAAASRAVDTHCHRQFGLLTGPEARYYTARWSRELGRWYVDIDDLMTTVGLVVNADLADDGTYTDLIDELALRPVNAAAKARPWTRIVVHPTSAHHPNGRDAAVEVVARFGWTTVPTEVKEAALLQASRFGARRDSPYGVAGSPELGSEVRLARRVDPDVAVSLTGVIRWWAAA